MNQSANRSTQSLPGHNDGRGPSSRNRQAQRIRAAPASRLQALTTRTASPNEYRDSLLAKKTELISVLRNNPVALVGMGRVCEEDQAPLINAEFIAVQVNQISHEQLDLVNAALVRLDSGEYGICAECERPIGAQRLAAVPWATCCVACQEQFDSFRDCPECAPM